MLVRILTPSLLPPEKCQILTTQGGGTDPWSLLSEMKDALKQQTQGFNHLYMCEGRKLPFLFSKFLST